MNISKVADQTSENDISAKINNLTELKEIAQIEHKESQEKKLI